MSQSLAQTDYDVLIVGGGAAGISVAARLRHDSPALRVGIIEPSDKHYYQPLWTLVGGGVVPKSQSERLEKDLIPPGVQWVRDAVSTFSPESQEVRTVAGRSLKYETLVVAPGLQIDWDKVAGLKETLGKNGVCSNYSFETVDKTWEFIRNFQGGEALFTFPNTPVKCGGAPQKIMYLAEHRFRKAAIRDLCKVKFLSAGTSIFAVKKYADALNRVIEKRHIDTFWKRNLVEVDGPKKMAIFENLETGQRELLPFDLIHVTPPMSAPDFIKKSPLAANTGWIEVNKQTLQHTRFPNIFGLGDASNLPTSKTGAAIRKQAPVAVTNILAHRAGKPLTGSYDGYTSCPLVTGYGRLILAEFDYDGKPQESFPFDQSKERLSMYLLKKHYLPGMYWNKMLKGKA